MSSASAKLSPPVSELSTSPAAQPASASEIIARITRVQTALREADLMAVIIPTADPHLSEYLPAHWQIREWLSGFTGSAGTLVVTTQTAALWTDSRYWAQADRQLAGTGIVPMRQGGEDEMGQPVPEPMEWLAAHANAVQTSLTRPARIALDARVTAAATWQVWYTEAQANGMRLCADDQLLSQVWQDRPALPRTPLYCHPAAFVGQTSREKLARIRRIMQAQGATHHLLASLDDIAWVTNLRGSDVEYNPVFMAYLLISMDTAWLCVDAAKVTDAEVREALADAGLTLAGYDDIQTLLSKELLSKERLSQDSSSKELLSKELEPQAKRPRSSTVTLWAERRTVTAQLLADAGVAVTGLSAQQVQTKLPSSTEQASERVPTDSTTSNASTLKTSASTKLIDAPSPSILLKAMKTERELAHIREAMRQDGAALCEFFAQFERRLAASTDSTSSTASELDDELLGFGNGMSLTELDVDTMLIAARSRQPHYISPSFATIAGFAANGAQPHYRAELHSHAVLSGDGLLLIDSGAQYLNGTTDITRMVGIGQISEAQKRDVTLVLKAHIALASAVFPDGIAAPLLDSICRVPLWQHQIDFGHGTGHGVGYFLNVHEGPQAIAYRASPATFAQRALYAGMVTSNEPALYRDGQWGIRIENLMATVPVAEPQEHAFGKFLRFETLTLCPIDTRLLLPEMLSLSERTWLNDYHAHVRAQLADRVTGEALTWLLARTEPI